MLIFVLSSASMLFIVICFVYLRYCSYTLFGVLDGTRTFISQLVIKATIFDHLSRYNINSKYLISLFLLLHMIAYGFFRHMLTTKLTPRTQKYAIYHLGKYHWKYTNAYIECKLSESTKLFCKNQIANL